MSPIQYAWAYADKQIRHEKNTATIRPQVLVNSTLYYFTPTIRNFFFQFNFFLIPLNIELNNFFFENNTTNT